MSQEKKLIISNRPTRHVLTICTNLLLIFVAGFLSAQQTPQQLVDKMGRGLNLGNVLSAPVEGNWSGPATEQYFTEVAEAGFSNVRIPIDFFGERTTGDTSEFSVSANTAYGGSGDDFVVDASYLDRLEQVIGWGLSKNLVIVLDFHGATLKSEFIYTFDESKGEFTHPSSAKRAADLTKFYSIWEQVANRFKDYSDDLVFEIINEPYFHISESEMNTINNEVVSIIRNSGGGNITRKIILVGGTKTSYEAITTIDSQILNDDDYLIATFHYYRPFSFTKSSDDTFDTNNWGSQSDKNNVDFEFDIVKSWADSFNPPVAVYLGEFGADNTYGFDYSSGDLLSISSNSSGFADGGPDPNSRADYHGYVANAAISRGFAFSAWDAGGKSSKAIHLRKDSGLIVYDFDAFDIESFVPKQTTASTVIETEPWVENVKNALLAPYSERECLNNTVLKNIDFECGFDTHWSFQTFGNVVDANFEDASFAARQGSHAAKISVTQSNNLNSAILSNEIIINDGSLDNKQLIFNVYGKASDPDLGFKLRVKYLKNGAVNYAVSSLLNLDVNYPENPYEFVFEVPAGTSEFQFQVLCGASEGTYYFDDFNVIQNTLSPKELHGQFEIYPNPIKEMFIIQSPFPLKRVALLDINGKKVLQWDSENRDYDIYHIKNGIYFIEIESLNNLVCIKKIIKN